MKVQDPPVSTPEPELRLLATWEDRERGKRTIEAAIGSAIAHVFLVLGAFAIATYVPPMTPRPASRDLDVRASVPLVAPPKALTQRAPNTQDVRKELKLENLIARPEIKPSPRVFSSPPAPPPGRQAAPPVPVLEPSQVAISQAPPPMPGTSANLPVVAPPKPQIQAEEKPKLAFETPGAYSGRPGGTGRVEAPKTGVEEAIRNASRGGAGGVQVGDVGADLDGGIGQAMGQQGSPGKQASSLELLSDPMGIDFKPYLIRVLTAVRRNWFAVIPESARFGRRGKVVVQFSINKVGSVPKLVIVQPSGTDALDRAAVAGVSASNPFPPLPTEFRGDQIRVQLAFFYNVPTR